MHEFTTDISVFLDESCVQTNGEVLGYYISAEACAAAEEAEGKIVQTVAEGFKTQYSKYVYLAGLTLQLEFEAQLPTVKSLH